MHKVSRFWVQALLLWGLSFTAQADGQKISVVDAFKLAANDEILLVDVRSEAEWVETGIAPNAVTLTVHQEGGLAQFSNKLQALIEQNPDKPIALICAGGVRTHHAQAYLEKQGISNVLDVTEGMVGGFFTKGWIDHNYPVEAYKVEAK